jgi:hypothetical protein
MKMGLRDAISAPFKDRRLATGAAPLAVPVARFFGLDAGDWSTILLGLALSGLLLALI